MHQIGLRQFSMLVLAAAMVAVGVAGLTNAVSPTLVLAATLLVVAVVLTFDLGRMSTDLW